MTGPRAQSKQPISRRDALAAAAALSATALANAALPPRRASASAPGPDRAAPLGSTPDATGTTFRVWAPHGSSVSVSGDFNGWSASADALQRDAGGYWSGRVPAARTGHQYRYLIHNGSKVFSRRDPAGRLVTTSAYGVGNTVIYDAGAFDWGSDDSFRRRPLDELVIYELHVGTFNAPRAGYPGSFVDAIARLDHVRDVGATAVEVLPVNESPGRFFTGYGPAEQFAVENAAYGGPDGFKAFVKACHERDLNVILDVVHNHWGPWDLEVSDFDGWSPATYPGGVYFYDAERIDSPWGPRPDYAAAPVLNFILDSLHAWLVECRVDGFRWDSTSNIDDTDSGHGIALPEGWRLMQKANRRQRRLAPGTISIAEDFLDRDAITADVSAGGAGFDSQWSYLVSPLRTALAAPAGSQRDLSGVADALGALYNDRAAHRIVYSESHNETAAPGKRLNLLIDPADPDSWRARKLTSLGAAVTFTAPGIPMVWQGQEFLDRSPLDPKRPLDWARLGRLPGTTALYRDLADLSLNATGRTAGLRGDGIRVFLRDDELQLLAYLRWRAGGPGDDVVVVTNFSGRAVDATVGFPAGGEWVTRLNSDDKRYAADFGGVGSAVVVADGPPLHGLATSGRVTVAAYSALALSQ